MHNKVVCAITLCMGLTFATPLNMTLYQDPNCGCCGEWAKYMQQEGFNVQIIKESNMKEIKEKNKITNDYMSCHTALIDNYVIEGHVPPQDVKRLLKEKPKDAIGISVPDMPMGSYGMDYGPKKEKYNVLLLLKDGSSKIYSTYNGKELLSK